MPTNLYIHMHFTCVFTYVHVKGRDVSGIFSCFLPPASSRNLPVSASQA